MVARHDGIAKLYQAAGDQARATRLRSLPGVTMMSHRGHLRGVEEPAC
jgi:hypothetical protein